MPDFPLIEMGQEYRFVGTKARVRVLCLDGSWPGHPVVIQAEDGGCCSLLSDGRVSSDAEGPFIERVPKRITLKVNVFRQRGGLYVRGESELLDWGGKIASLDIEFEEGQGL